ncbi:hypothetical protein KOR42_36600 [Thalassoglobus neptunius]|uniref:Uncharacterized protein n=1 Tax=Thalassoglobus neptunius TaxID=1938619 RepID=A0A5C5WJG4_9PLAN|nr:hypothetical protein [Thalassoglobus neptunius]TWT50113.1 hypothetical protein KOR42_36600 [Thalassoglobus neptunius]
MARRQVEETAFGSDSFLDIVANIVGILIILIVVAGVRVSRTPLLSVPKQEASAEQKSPETVTLWANAPVDNDEPIEVDLAFVPAMTPEEIPVEIAPFVPPEVGVFEPIPDAAVSAELLQVFEQMQEELAQLTAQWESVRNQFSEHQRDREEISQQSEELERQLTSAESALSQRRQQLEFVEIENARSSQVIEQLRERLADVQNEEPETKKLAHRLNPVGRAVSGQEVHFCLENGQVSYVPVDELTDLVKQQMQRRKDFLLKQPRYQATVGPVNGYEMEFLVQRHSNGLLGDSRFGANLVKISVTDWVIRPAGDVRGETSEEALQSHSQFRRALISQGTNATITFWVYPDSYELHQDLKSFLHDYGFWVASRPLPSGFPIAGSASGSKSIAQ